MNPRTISLLAILATLGAGGLAQGADPAPADGNRPPAGHHLHNAKINPMLSWFPVFPGGAHWTNDGGKILCDAPTSVELRVEPAVKSAPILKADKPWETGDIGWAQVIRDQGRFRMWYQTKPAAKGPKGIIGESFLCYAESDDGFEWRKPQLGLFEFNGGKSNNILRRADKGLFVFRDPSAPPSERYRIMTRRVWHEGEGGKILDREEVERRRAANNAVKAGRAEGSLLPMSSRNVVVASHSPDGLRWTRYPEPILDDGHTHDTQNTFTHDAKRGTYVGYFRLFYGYRRAIGRSETGDFLRWPATQWSHHSLIEDAPDATLYSNAYSPYPDNPDIHLMFPAIYHQIADACDAQLMVSMDGLNWSRHTKEPIIRRGGLGERDEGGIYPVPQLLRFRDDHKFRIPIRMTPIYHNQKRDEPTDAIAWAEWPEDRLAGISARGEGQFTLAPMVCGDRLLANFRTEKGGRVRFELAPPPVWPPLPAPGIEGYRFEDMTPMSGDQSHVPVNWAGKAGLTALRGKPVAIRVRMHKATLYSVAMAGRQE